MLYWIQMSFESGVFSSSSSNICSKSMNDSAYSHHPGSFGWCIGFHSLITHLVNPVQMYVWKKCSVIWKTWISNPALSLNSCVDLGSHLTLLSSISFSENKDIKIWQYKRCIPDLSVCDSVLLIVIEYDAVCGIWHKNSTLHILLSEFSVSTFPMQMNISIHANNPRALVFLNISAAYFHLACQ